MPSILVLGAGRSSSALIDHLLLQAKRNQWFVTVGDVSLPSASDRVGNSQHGKAVLFDIHQDSAAAYIQQADVVISVLPALLHPLVAKKCLEFGKHLLTASYVSDEMRSLDTEAKNKGILFLNECGLDPGIDHMSALHVLDRIQQEGGAIHSFESFTGGLIAPETDPENPWRYKFTWNPRNVVMAGQGTAKYLQQGQFKYIPYQQLFRRTTPVNVPDYGAFEGYPNRDSLQYREAYGLQGIKTMVRGTLRNKGFCSAWDIFVQLGCTDDTYRMEDVAHLTHLDFINSFLDYHSEWSVEEKIAHRLGVSLEGPELQRLNWSGLFDNTLVGLQEGTPAQLLEHILNKRWKLASHDRDMIVMWHRFLFLKDGREQEIQASLVALGDNSIRTAMAKTVGLPLAIAASLLLQEKIKLTGVRIPVVREIYEPVLLELKSLGIELQERSTS
jgi:saccharopine dehydrogenase (NADP+, L-glutamate forming)